MTEHNADILTLANTAMLAALVILNIGWHYNLV